MRINEARAEATATSKARRRPDDAWQPTARRSAGSSSSRPVYDRRRRPFGENGVRSFFRAIDRGALMVTADDVRRVRIFTDLDQRACERLARAAADVSLAAGEYASHEGDERALFALLEGRIEAVKVVDGIDRVVGERRPGDIFGEVPITLGTLFPVGFRAAEPSRVMRIEPNDYHALAAVAPDVAKEVGRLAADRMGGRRGLQGIAAEPPPPRVLVLGHQWDPSCGELRAFLHRNQISFNWLKPDEPASAGQWGAPVPVGDDLPAIRVIGGKTVVKP